MLTRLTKTLQNDPIFEPQPSLDGLDAVAAVADSSVYLGTGLCTPEFLSAGMPFDVLSMIFAAEKIRRILGNGAVYHLIADTHALSNGLFAPADVHALAERQHETLLRVSRNFGFRQYNVVVASALHSDPTYNSLLQNFPAEWEDHEYVRRELTDIEWFRQFRGVSTKVGWIIQASSTTVRYDERLFDGRYREAFNVPMSFVYVRAGRTFDKARPKAPPYIAIPGERRLLLTPDEDVHGKLRTAVTDLGDNGLNGGRRHLSNILRAYQDLVAPLPAGSVEDKIAAVIRAALS